MYHDVLKMRDEIIYVTQTQRLGQEKITVLMRSNIFLAFNDSENDSKNDSLKALEGFCLGFALSNF
jgi:hypothetical protein